MLIIGVTGTIASGKSTVDRMLIDVGATVIDADHVVHEVLREDQDVRAAIRKAFGDGVLAPDGSIDRRALGRVVFGDAQSLRRLEGMLYPAVRSRIRSALASMSPDALVVIDAVKLLEGELGALVDSVWWVTATLEQQRARLLGRGLREQEAQARLDAQPALASWRDRVDVVIDNSGTLADTRNQVLLALNNVSTTHHHPGGDDRQQKWGSQR